MKGVGVGLISAGEQAGWLEPVLLGIAVGGRGG